MLTPIAVAVARAMADNGHKDPRLGVALVLGVAYAASIGGMGTPVGSPTNVIAMGFLTERGVDLSFVQWMMLGLPVVLLLLPVRTTWRGDGRCCSAPGKRLGRPVGQKRGS
jgi:sodium-dependent dicarboxylate transporter 2/3/5